MQALIPLAWSFVFVLDATFQRPHENVICYTVGTQIPQPSPQPQQQRLFGVGPTPCLAQQCSTISAACSRCVPILGVRSCRSQLCASPRVSVGNQYLRVPVTPMKDSSGWIGFGTTRINADDSADASTGAPGSAKDDNTATTSTPTVSSFLPPARSIHGPLSSPRTLTNFVSHQNYNKRQGSPVHERFPFYG